MIERADVQQWHSGDPVMVFDPLAQVWRHGRVERDGVVLWVVSTDGGDERIAVPIERPDWLRGTP